MARGCSGEPRRPPVQLSALDGHDPVGGAGGGTDAAGIQEQRPPPAVHQGPVGVAEEKQVQLPFLRRVAGGQERLLYPVGVAVAQEDALAPDLQQPFGGLDGAEVAVAGDLFQGNVRKAVAEPLASRQQSPRWRIRSGSVSSTARSMGAMAPWESESTRISIESSFQRPFPQYSGGRRRMQILLSAEKI